MADQSGLAETLKENPLVAQLIAQGAENALILRGYVGPAASDGQLRLFPRLNNLSTSIEIARADVLHAVAAPSSSLGAVVLWVKSDAKISVRRVGVPETASVPAANLADRRGRPAGPARRNLVEVRRGRLRMQVRAQEGDLAPYCEIFCDEGCLIDPYPQSAE